MSASMFIPYGVLMFALGMIVGSLIIRRLSRSGTRWLFWRYAEHRSERCADPAQWEGQHCPCGLTRVLAGLGIDWNVP